MSANSAVTVLRSPSRFSDAGASVTRIWLSRDFFAGAVAAGTPSGPPHWPQNLAAGAFSKPQAAQGVLNGAPHSLQNFNPSGFSVLHFVHSIYPFPLRAQFVEQRLGVLQVGGVEAFGEPVVDLAEHRARLLAAIGVAKKSRECSGRAQFPPFRTLISRDLGRFAILL